MALGAANAGGFFVFASRARREGDLSETHSPASGRKASPDGLLTLYKYRSLAGERGRQFAEDVILHGRMWWQSPISFNDPFDCDPVLVFGKTRRDREQFAKSTGKNLLAHARRSVRQANKRMILSENPERQAAQMRAGFRQWMAESAVTCFSEVCDSALMWGHYADSHRGVCFAFRESLSAHWVALDVLYSEERPVVDGTKLGVPDNVKLALLSKSSEWRYEREHRMVEYRSPAGYRPIPPQALIGVIYGSRISAEDRTYVDGLIERRGGLSRYDAQVDERFFRMNIEPR